MFAKFFIDRPVFATVLALLITLLGVVAIQNLPIAQFPEIVPPSVQISATYPGASAETVAQSVAAPIEQQLSGARHLIYYSSQSGNDGVLKITATFEIGSDQDLAAVEVQNRLAIAQPRLPQEVVRQGITVTKTSTSMLCVVALQTESNEYDDVFLANYATINILDALKRVPGVGDAQVFGGKDYAMRVWVDPDRLAQKAFTVTDLANAIRDQNAVFPAGRVGQRPGPADQQLTLPVLTRGRLENPEDYESIILRANPDGSMLRLKDIAKVELGSQTYDLFGRLDGKATTLVLIYLQTGANALSTFRAVEETMKDAERSFPKGVKWLIPYDTVKFIEASMESVIHTLVEAGILVILVVFIFLQSWRATLIPLVAVPVSIIGTFAGMLALGFTINSLTLFGMVLAIGIVVDDAIVVVENVERIMHDEKLPVREATVKAMEQVTGPVIAIVLVLGAVFLPVAFLGGLTGELYRQFAVTIAVSVAISGLIALTLSPAMCRILLKPGHGTKFFLFRWFNTAFDGLTHAYSGTVKLSIKLAAVTVLIFGGLLFATYRLNTLVPGGFIPDEDQGYIIVAMILPDGASIDRTDKLASEVETFLKADPNVEHTVMLGGYDFLAGGINSTNTGIMFARLKPWSERTAPNQTAQALIGKVWGKFASNREGLVLPFNPPAIQGLGQRAGFEFQLQARGAGDIRDLAGVSDKFMAAAAKRPEISALNSTLRVNTPQLFVDLDRDKAKMLGLSLTEIFNSLQAYLGALYVNDFDKFGRIWRVQVQAEPQFRKSPQSITNIYVRNTAGEMVPLSGVISVKLQSGPNSVARFNGFPAVQITGAPGAGFSTGDSMAAMREVAAEVLPPGYGYEWSGASYQEIKAGNQAPMVVGFGLIVVFLVLAAQYEKWSTPFAVLLAVPIGIFGALLAVFLRNFPNDIYFQIGCLTLVGLAAKNAILIVEFCAMERASGKGLVESAVNASRLRFRPIVMTSLAFILGVVPLAIARGAGAAGRQSIGTGVLGGMIAATFLAIFFVPVFFVLIQGLAEKLFGVKHGRDAAHPDSPVPPAAASSPPAATH